MNLINEATPPTPCALMLLYLWKNRTLFIGHAPENPAFIAAASVVFIGLDGPIQIETPNTHFTAQAALVTVGTKTKVHAKDRLLAALYLDPFGHDLARLRPLSAPDVEDAWPLPELCSSFVALFNHAYQHQPTADEFFRDIDRLICSTHVPIPAIDKRIVKAIELIRSPPDHCERNAQLAAATGLSLAQLRRDFPRVTGLSVRRYRLWCRLFFTAGFMQANNSLTQAACLAGFSDSAHFAKTFREMAGVKPSSILKALQHMRIIVGSDLNE